MKAKVDFITNSSSANFILYVQTTDKTKDLFVDSIKYFLEQYLIDYGWNLKQEQEQRLKSLKDTVKRYKKDFTKNDTSEFTKMYLKDLKTHIKELEEDPEYYKKHLIDNVISSIKQTTPNVFTITYFTSMLNDMVDDCPHYMATLIFEYVRGNGIKYGIENLKLEIEDDH
jgi:hypothetical protein